MSEKAGRAQVRLSDGSRRGGRFKTDDTHFAKEKTDNRPGVIPKTDPKRTGESLLGVPQSQPDQSTQSDGQ